MSIKLQLPTLVDMKPRLTVIGVGGAGCNAVNNMIAAGLQGVEFVVANTDAQSLAASSAEYRVQLGANLTEGLGAGSRPEIGEAAAEEAIAEIRTLIAGSHMVFIAAGMGGGTGTGAATVVARAARDVGALTVGVVCKPFAFEGARRMRIAEAGVQALRQHVDTLIVIPNQNLFRIANERTTFAEAFVLADQVLYSGVACIVELVLKEGLINLDFADVRTIMSGMGTAMMGTGEATGERRAVLAAEEAIANPLLDDVTLRGARGLLLSISGGRDMTLYEVDEAASRVRQEVDTEANIIVGATFDEQLGDRLRVSIVASGMHRGNEQFAVPRGPHPGFGPHGGSAPESGAGNAPFVQSQASGQQANTKGAAAQPGDLQRRLAEALQPSQASAPHNYSSSSPSESQHSRDSWIAPGNVMVEDGLQNFPPLTGSALLRTPPLPLAGAPGSENHSFEPQPPTEFQRTSRRLPAIEDFPPQAQKQWNAHRGASDGRAEQQAKTGLFGRLANLSKGMKQAQGKNAVHVADDDDEPQSLPAFVARDRR
jgi:cell division protein FtsZ